MMFDENQFSSSTISYLTEDFSTRKLTNSSRTKRRRIASVAQRRAANVRERRRMFSLNEAFDKLREIVPIFSYEKKLSRIETLRLAIIYISFMTDLLVGGKTVDQASLNGNIVFNQFQQIEQQQNNASIIDLQTPSTCPSVIDQQNG